MGRPFKNDRIIISGTGKLMKLLLFWLLPLLLACNSEVSYEEKHEVSLKIEELDSPTKASIRGIWVLDSNCIWLSGASGTILRSLNGGDSWQLLPSPDSDSLDFRDVHAFSKESALVVSAGFPARIYLTENAGEDWQLVYENTDSSAFMNSVHFKDSLNGVIVGDVLNNYHFLLESSDGGSSWKRIDSSKLPKPLAVEHAFAASGSCIALNDGGKFVVAFGGMKSRVLREVGDKWVASELPVDDSVESSGIYSIASGGGILMTAGGDYSKIDREWPALYSNDGGKSWKVSTSNYNGYRSIIDYSPRMNLWLAAGTNGMDLFIPETGLWEKKISEKSINTLQFDPSSDQLWAAGPDGSIYRIIFKR